MLKLKFLLIFILCCSFSAVAQKPKEKIINFSGELKKGKIYRAEIDFDEKNNEWQTVKRLKLPFHHAGRIEWMNIKSFNFLHTSKQKIVFKVISKKVYQADKNRWNMIYKTKILYLISDNQY